MGYRKATDVLPDDIISLLQSFVEGEYIYVPKRKGNEKGWGELSGAKATLKSRNEEIVKKYLKGEAISSLAQEYFLAENTIRKIIWQNSKV